MNYIYRDFSIDMTKQQCTDFIQIVALSKACITCSFTTANSIPEAAINRCTMFFRLEFIKQEQVEKFDSLVLARFGKVSTPPPKISMPL